MILRMCWDERYTCSEIILLFVHAHNKSFVPQSPYNNCYCLHYGQGIKANGFLIDLDLFFLTKLHLLRHW